MERQHQRQNDHDDDFSAAAVEEYHEDGDYEQEFEQEEEEQAEQENYLENVPPEDPDDGGGGVDYTKKVDEYFLMLQEATETLSRIDGGYQGKLEKYIKKRNEESSLYREVTAVGGSLSGLGGGDGDLTEINRRTEERRWRATTKVNGPAWKRALERDPPTKMKGLSKREQSVVSKNLKDRSLWGKIMSLPPSFSSSS
jgi:hypothetical protein